MKKNINIRRKKVIENLEKVISNAKHVPKRFKDKRESYGIEQRKVYIDSLNQQIATLKERIANNSCY